MTGDLSGSGDDRTIDPHAMTAEVPEDRELRAVAADDRHGTAMSTARKGRRAGPLWPLATASLAVHLCVLWVALLIADRAPPAPEHQETPIEVVQEPPPEKPAPSAKQHEMDKPPEQKPPEPPAEKPPEPKQSPEVQDPPKAEQPKPEQPKPEQPKPEQPKPEQPKPEQAKPEQSKPASAPEPPKAAAEEAAKLQSLQAELAALQAQKAELQAQTTKEETKALGLLPDSFSAVVLPSVSADGEDPISYQQAVYSKIAKAKKSDTKFLPGVAHVVFDVDEKGALVSVTLDHSSGNAVVDAEALALVRRAAPFPPPPRGASRHFPAYMSFVADH